MTPYLTEEGEVVPEHSFAALYGIFALALGAAVWSGMVAVSGLWALSAAPGLGWMIAWACRYGGRRTDTFIRAAGWVLALAGALLALFAFSAFSATQTSPDSGFQLHAAGLEYLRLFAEPPWLGSAAVLLALAGARHALRDRPSRRAPARPVQETMRPAERSRPGVRRAAAGESSSRAA